jgi:tetrahydromethanopterin S-methyltransferase subunit F
LPCTRGLIGRSLSDTAGLFSGLFAGSAGGVFHALLRLFILLWVCHVFLHDL